MSSGDETAREIVEALMPLAHQKRPDMIAANVAYVAREIATARAAGIREGLERAAKMAEEPGSGLRDKRLHAAAIRALIDSPGEER